MRGQSKDGLRVLHTRSIVGTAIDGLERRIRAIGDLADTGRLLDVWNCDWRESLQRASSFDALTADEIVVYLDSPYVLKAPTLYEWSFESGEHRELSKALLGSQGFRWLLSYDDNPIIRALYENQAGHAFRTVEYRYTAAGSATRKSKSELLVSNYLDVPTDLSSNQPQSLRGNNEERAQ